MSDIASELRDYEIPDLGPHTAKSLRSLLDRAADEIERLRSLVGKARVSSGFSRERFPRIKPQPMVEPDEPPWDK